MATIKRSELNELKQACANNREDADYYFAQWQAAVKEAKKFDSEAAMWCKHTVHFMDKSGTFRNKLWAAEQEIHDLKYALEREQNENDQTTDEWEALVAEQDKDIQDLSNWVLDLLQQPAPINPPACLKPLDALNWSATSYVNSHTYHYS